MSEPSTILGNDNAVLLLLEQQGHQLGRISNHITKLEASVADMTTKLAVLESRDYNSELVYVKARLDRLESYKTAQIGVFDFFGSIGKNLPWVILLIGAVLASFGLITWERVSGN